MKAISGFGFALVLAGICNSAALACDQIALKTNMDWVKQNNPDASAKIARGCANFGENWGLNLIYNGYKEGQKQNPAAAALIDACTTVQYGGAACGSR